MRIDTTDIREIEPESNFRDSIFEYGSRSY